MLNIERIVTGGQTGVDRAALDVAIRFGIPYSGWCPKGRLAEDGVIDERYVLREADSSDYGVRTELNVRDSDATLIVAFGELEGGTKLTEDCAIKLHRPFLVVDILGQELRQDPRDWMSRFDVKVLNIAGPRESLRPGEVYARSFNYLMHLFAGAVDKPDQGKATERVY